MLADSLLRDAGTEAAPVRGYGGVCAKFSDVATGDELQGMGQLVDVVMMRMWDWDWVGTGRGAHDQESRREVSSGGGGTVYER